MPITVYLELTLSACAATFSPGPNNILLLSSVSAYGFRKCLPLLYGIWSGLLTVTLLCGFDCAALSSLAPQVVPLAKYVGTAYVLYLACKMLRHKGQGASAEPKPLTYVNGFLLQFLNVKFQMLSITFYSGFFLPYGFQVRQVLAFAGIMTLCAGTGNLIWSALGSILFPVYQRHERAVSIVMALLMVWCARKILTD